MTDEIRVSESIEVGDLGVGEPDTENETLVEPDVTEVFDVVVDTDETDHSRDDEFAMDVTQASAADVAEDGTIVADVVTAVVDEASGVTMIDEVVGVVTPDGTEIAEERVSVIDPDGNYAVVAEEVEVVES